MNTNIFDFQNSESSMQFNPLFLPANTFVENPGTIKSFKLSNSSYLFSDIIKVVAGSTGLTKNPDTKLNFPSEISSSNIPSANVFSFNLSNINNLQDLGKVLNNGQTSVFNLNEIITLINQLFQSGCIGSLKNGIQSDLNNPPDDKVLTGDGLNAFLNELNNLLTNAGVKENSSKEKNKTDEDSQQIISKIISSLKCGAPVIINIIGKNETLKIELNKIDVQVQGDNSANNNHISNLTAELPIAKENLNNSINVVEIQNNQEINLSALEQSVKNISLGESYNTRVQDVVKDITGKNPGDNISTEQTNAHSNSAEQSSQNSKINLINQAEAAPDLKTKMPGQDIIDNLFSKFNENGTESLNENKIPSVISKIKTQAAGTINKIASDKSPSSPKFLNIDKNTGNSDIYKLKLEIVNNEKTIDMTESNQESSGSDKNSSYSLSVENLIASKSSLKNISKSLNRQEDILIKSDVKIEVGNKYVDVKNAGNTAPEIKSGKNDVENFPTKLKQESAKTNPNTQKILNEADSDTQVSKDIKVAGRDSQLINHKDTISNSHSTENVKTDNSGNINLNNNSTEDNLSNYLSGNNQDLFNHSKDQNQIPNDNGEIAFSSYINKIDSGGIQNISRAVYLNNISDQMKTIDSTEIVKEISKLASEKDQKNIVLKLVPETLGKVKIMMDVSNNIIHAHAEVENEAAKSLMQNNIENLKQALAQQGMQLNSLNISLSNHQEQKANRSYLSKRKFNYTDRQIGEIDEKEHTNVSKHYGYNTYEFLA